ncbi:hypothetical protein CRG98_048527 [Punica granatum]|uniref:Uncharacterized protein n=1 Tax=Punica granatum TaxID=22663 RepID=A0A2I0HHB7_PUNGR|nr:hypothetical protein CRG98_048527 [Punica granatum]
MSCLSLSLKLPPARKAWKIFTSKLQKKLPNFHRRPNKLTYHRSLRTHKLPRALGTTNKAVPMRVHGKNRPSSSDKLVKSRPHQPRLYAFKKRNAPVFVDKLFKDPTCTNSTLSVTELGDYKTGVRGIKESSGSGSGSGTSDCKESDMPTGPEDAGMPCGGDGGGDDDDCMWESVGLASPSMQNIDERAEAFIAKFWAEMKNQEAMARRQL